MKPKNKGVKKLIKPLVGFEPSKDDIAILQQGIKSPFWEVFRQLLKEEKEIAEVAVFENEALSDGQRDDLRLRRNLLQYIIELPQLVIEKSIPKPKQKEPDFETY